MKLNATLKLAGVAICLVALLSLLMNGGLLLRRESLRGSSDPVSFAQPVDRSRWIRLQNKSKGSAITVARMTRKKLGSEHVSEWPLFWILTAPKYETTRCQEILESWGKQVPPDSLVFIGAEQNRTTRHGHRFVALDAPPEMKSLKEFLGWHFVVQEYPEREWFVKGDDDTYFIVNNLNRYLEQYDPRLPYFLGCKFHMGGPGGLQYVSGGAGYVLSQESAHRMSASTPRCLRYYGRLPEGDVAIAECLQTVGVVPEDTRDDRGRQRFHAFPHSYHANWFKMGFHATKWWYHDWVWGNPLEGSFCCDENTTVSFHYMSTQMRHFAWPAPKEHVAIQLDPKLLMGQVPGLQQAGNFDLTMAP